LYNRKIAPGKFTRHETFRLYNRDGLGPFVAWNCRSAGCASAGTGQI
jgi:hypothetical protein